MQIPMSSSDIIQKDIDAVVGVLKTPTLSNGPQIKAFEAAFANYVGIKHAIAVNSGTSGLHLTMISSEVGEEFEVISPSFSFISSANCILYERGKPVFAEIDIRTGNMDPQAVEAAVTPHTKAIIVVHAFGQPADLDPIMKIARKHHLYMIEDACESIGSTYKGRSTGLFGDAAVYAFYPNKQMTTGEGGMIVTNRDDWSELFRSLRNQGRDVFNEWLDHARLGYNYRMDEMSAALGLAQLQRIEELIEKRAQVAHWYNERIDEMYRVGKPYIAPTTTRMSWFLYVVRCNDDVNRGELMNYLQANGIPSRPYFTPIHLQPIYRQKYGYKEGDFPLTEKAGNTFLALPFSGVMSENQVEYVCKHMQEFLNKI